MDDAVKNPTPQAQNSNTGQPGVVSQTPQPVAPVSGAKEMPPVKNEWVSASNPEVVLPKEVKDAGVEAKPIVTPLPQQATSAGVQMAKEATPVVPVKEEAIGMKTPRSLLTQLLAVHKNVKDSFTWLVRLVVKEQDKKEKGGVL